MNEYLVTAILCATLAVLAMAAVALGMLAWRLAPDRPARRRVAAQGKDRVAGDKAGTVVP